MKFSHGFARQPITAVEYPIRDHAYKRSASLQTEQNPMQTLRSQDSFKPSVMKQTSLLGCLLLILTTSCTRSAPAQGVRSTSDSSDPRWRMVAQMDAARIYTQREVGTLT